MEYKRFKPMLDKLYYLIWIPTSVLMIAMTVFACFEPITLFVVIPVDVFTFYFLITSLFGYVELREDSVFIKFGFIMKREIPYKNIRSITKERKMYADSMVALKNSLDHVNIKYNRFDMISVSVVGNDELISEIEVRIKR